MKELAVLKYEPIQQGGSTPASNTPKKNPINNINKYFSLLKIGLKLALINGFNDEFKIKSQDGSYVEGSNIIQLLNFALSHGKRPVGETDFVKLLSEAKIDPSMIKQDDIRSKLEQLNRISNPAIPSSSPTFPSISVTESNPLSNQKNSNQIIAPSSSQPEHHPTTLNQNNKRNRDEEEDELGIDQMPTLVHKNKKIRIQGW